MMGIIILIAAIVLFSVIFILICLFIGEFIGEQEGMFISGFCIGAYNIILSLIISGLLLTPNITIKEMTLYQNGNIEIKGTNYFGSNDTRKFSFSDYKVVESDDNICIGFKDKIELTVEYYEQYEDALKNEKSITIKIKK
ncbi:hypothetical protein N5B56_01725 [Eubacterium sp. LFL-14]|mgnify:FL=1|uniref:DUF5673 domain-containing protein n=1 Tax=Eubacterium album TaxID=2978477 RepID=A0ABT2LWY3_9FIRM|nr:hypothetical protein [Eubacterium sp. LFL-14]MCT7397806.1 hypothetical protein [Eubacterium sp. LFL-14]